MSAHLYVSPAAPNAPLFGTPLFDSLSGDPLFVTNPQTKLEHAFAKFHKANPEVYEAIEYRALNLWRAGAPRIGVRMIFELVRYDAAVKTNGKPFKLANAHAPFYARLLIRNNNCLANKIVTNMQTHLLSKRSGR